MSLARRVPATGRAGTGRSWPAWTVLALSIGLWAATLGLGRAHGPLPGVPGLDVVDVVTYSAFLAWTVAGSVPARPSSPWWRCWAAGRSRPAAGRRRGLPRGRRHADHRGPVPAGPDRPHRRANHVVALAPTLRW